MATLNGFLDGDTAAALKGLYGVDSDVTSDTETEKANNWDEDYDSEIPVEEYCDRCGSELTEEEFNSFSKDQELLCESCDRREHNHTVDRFLSTREIDLD